MPSIERNRNGVMVKVYFDTEEQKQKYEGNFPSLSCAVGNTSKAVDKRIKKAFQLQGDRDCLKVYQHEYDKGNYKTFDHTPEQVRTIYKDALMGGLK